MLGRVLIITEFLQKKYKGDARLNKYEAQIEGNR